MFLSLRFSVPTATIGWFALNRDIGMFTHGENYLGGTVLLAVIMVLALIAFFSESRFLSLLDRVWRFW